MLQPLHTASISDPLHSYPTLSRLCVVGPVILLPPSIVFGRYRHGPFQPATRAIRHKFDEFNATFMNGRHATVVLPHVDARLDPVEDLVGRHHQSHQAAAAAVGTDYHGGLERERVYNGPRGGLGTRVTLRVILVVQHIQTKTK